jgi:hypothetical protein
VGGFYHPVPTYRSEGQLSGLYKALKATPQSIQRSIWYGCEISTRS